MPKFRNREEYEEWKRNRLKSNLERSRTPEDEGEIEEEETRGETSEFTPAAHQLEREKEDLRPLGELFSDCWEIFKRRFGTLILLYLFSGLSFVIVLGIFVGLGFGLSLLFPEGKHIIIASCALIGALPASLALFWGIAALVFAVADEQLGIRDALEAGWGRVFSYMWLVSVQGFIVAGGFLLFLIPGIIFLVWFSFGQFILVSEGNRGMDALLKSKGYVRDRWFDVCLRLFLVWFVSGLVSMIPLLGQILGFLFFPFVMIFTYLIYQDLRSIKGTGVSYANSFGEKCTWIGVGTLGYIVFPLLVILLLIGIFGASLLTISTLLTKGMLLR